MAEQSFDLVCWHCGKRVAMVAERLPMHIFDIMEAAKVAGWTTRIDLNYNRTLVFCTDDCANAALTKKGYYPKYPRKAKNGTRQDDSEREAELQAGTPSAAG